MLFINHQIVALIAMAWLAWHCSNATMSQCGNVWSFFSITLIDVPLRASDQYGGYVSAAGNSRPNVVFYSFGYYQAVIRVLIDLSSLEQR